jgi:hypothetical protein
MSDLKKGIHELAKEYQVMNLATITEDGKPRVWKSGRSSAACCRMLVHCR